MHASFDPYTPVQPIMMGLRHRYEACPWRETFHEFCSRVQSGPLDALRLRTLHLSINLSKLPPHGSGLPFQYGTALIAIRNNLEIGVRCCLLAKAPLEKPLRTLLITGMESCHATDSIQERLAAWAAELHAARVKGGKLRHAANDAARSEAARLLIVKRPAAGWTTPIKAARTIEDDLKRFILERRLGLVAGDHLVRTIVRWIVGVPTVHAAFTAKQ